MIAEGFKDEVATKLIETQTLYQIDAEHKLYVLEFLCYQLLATSSVMIEAVKSSSDQATQERAKWRDVVCFSYPAVFRALHLFNAGSVWGTFPGVAQTDCLWPVIRNQAQQKNNAARDRKKDHFEYITTIKKKYDVSNIVSHDRRLAISYFYRLRL